MRALLLTAVPGLETNRRLRSAAEDLGLDVEVVDATRIVAATTPAPCLWHEERDVLASAPDVVLARVGNWRPESLLAALEAAEAAGVPTPNPAAAIRTGRDHWQTMQRLAAAGLPAPATVAGADPETLARVAVARLGLPVVVKQRRSRMGVGVVRCSTRDHLEAVLDSLWRVGDEVVVQAYVATGGRSLRALVVGHEVVAGVRFTAGAGEWRSNAARGGTAEAWPLDSSQARLAVRAASALGLGVCGIDLLVAADGEVVGEVNPTPGFRALEAATGIDAAASIARYLLAVAAGQASQAAPPDGAAER